MLKRLFFASLFMLSLSACRPEQSLVIDTSHQAAAQEPRIRFVVLHYTAQDFATSLRLLTQGKVSSHYLLDKDGSIYQLVPDDKTAWHAGDSQFLGYGQLNDNSLGIELVNEGVAAQYREYKGYPSYHHFVDYETAQIDALATLLHHLIDTYHVPPSHLLSHSDIAPQRKLDVGAKFPWERLYRDYGLGAWYDEADKQAFMLQGFAGASVDDIKAQFRLYGYPMPQGGHWDKASQNVIYAFQLHFNPKNATGQMDLESWAILQALNKKYRYQ